MTSVEQLNRYNYLNWTTRANGFDDADLIFIM